MKNISKTIGGVEVNMRCSALTPILYRAEFKRDLFRDLASFQGSENGQLPDGAMEAMLKITYTCAKQADPEIEPFEEWIDQFGLMDAAELAGAVAAIVTDNEDTLVTAKKKKRQPTAK